MLSKSVEDLVLQGDLSVWPFYFLARKQQIRAHYNSRGLSRLFGFLSTFVKFILGLALVKWHQQFVRLFKDFRIT